MLWSADKITKLQKMQNWGLRIVFNNMHIGLDEDNLHVEAKLDLLKHRRVAHLLGIMYHRSKNVELLDVRDIHTRQFDKVKFKVFNPVIKKAFRSPKYLGAQLWDKLPVTTQLSGSFTEFKRKIKKHTAEGLFNGVRYVWSTTTGLL